jgi:hypothetical protein
LGDKEPTGKPNELPGQQPSTSPLREVRLCNGCPPQPLIGDASRLEKVPSTTDYECGHQDVEAGA